MYGCLTVPHPFQLWLLVTNNMLFSDPSRSRMGELRTIWLSMSALEGGLTLHRWPLINWVEIRHA